MHTLTKMALKKTKQLEKDYLRNKGFMRDQLAYPSYSLVLTD